MALPPFAMESLPSERVPDTSAFENFPFPPAPPIYVKEIATRVSLHPDAEKFLGPNSDIVQSDLQMLELLTSTFSAPMTAWRSQALQSASALASYYNLGAFAQSCRSGITKASSQYREVLPTLNAWLRSKFPGHSWPSICVNHNEAISMHRDLNNAEGSLNLTIALGNFSDGGLFVEAPDGAVERWCAAVGSMIRGDIHSTKAWPFAFSGLLWHASEPWQGDRWSITGYTCLGLDTFSDNDLSWLRSMGFPLPVRDCEDPLVKTVHSELHAQTAISVAASVVEPQLMVDTTAFEAPPFCLLVNAAERGSLVPAFSAAGIPHVCIAADDSGCCWQSKPCWESLMRCTVAGMFKFLFLVCAAAQTHDDAIASLHLAMACFHSGGHVCLDVHPNSCIWSLPMFSHLVSSAAVHLIQVRYMAQCTVSASWSWCTSLESGDSFVKAYKFMMHLTGARPNPCVSARVEGVAKSMAARKRPLWQAPELPVVGVSAVENFVLDSQEFFKVVVGGFILFCLFASARWSDAARATGLVFDESSSGLILIETSTRHYKTKAKDRKDAVLPLIALGNGLEQPAWGLRWIKIRNQLGLDSASCLMPAVTSAGTFRSRPMTAAEGTLWLREILHVQGVPGNLELYSSHSLKATALSWTAKSCAMTYEERLTQGHHCSPKQGMALLYSRDALAEILTKVARVVRAIQKGDFEPDLPRAERVARALCDDPKKFQHLPETVPEDLPDDDPVQENVSEDGSDASDLGELLDSGQQEVARAVLCRRAERYLALHGWG